MTSVSLIRGIASVPIDSAPKSGTISTLPPSIIAPKGELGSTIGPPVAARISGGRAGEAGKPRIRDQKKNEKTENDREKEDAKKNIFRCFPDG